jgi:hypothetical protein
VRQLVLIVSDSNRREQREGPQDGHDDYGRR